MKELKIPIKGMHCSSCEVMLTEELKELQDVQRVHVSLKTKTATIYGKHLPPQAVVRRAIKTAGYDIGYDETPIVSNNYQVYKDLFIGVVLVVLLALIFKRFGLNNISNLSLGGASVGIVALIIGLTAGFSTCMAMIGGLVLGISARHAEKHPTATPMQKFRPHLFFNLGRIAGFIVLGGVIGALGSAFQLTGSMLGLLTIIVGVVMLMLGLQLTELFPRLRGVLTLPSSFGRLIGIKKQGEREYSHRSAALLGALTFFLPCGFTQAMQLLAVSSGKATTGAVIMGAFAIGTAPGLLSIGGLTSIVKGVFAKRFFRVVGVAVVGMAMINLAHGYNLLGINNLFTRQNSTKTTTVAPKPVPAPKTTQPEPQKPQSENILKTTYYLSPDISPSKFTTKVGQKTTLIVDVKESGRGCMSTIMIPGLYDKPLFLQGGEKLKMTFTPQKAGKYQITCAMGVFRGTITVE